MSATEEMISVGDLSLSLQHFGWEDYLVFALMLIVCAAIGIYFGFLDKTGSNARNIKQRRGSEALDYLVGGRQMKIFPVSMSLVASYISGISLLGTSTEIYVYGTPFAFILVAVVLSGIASWYLFLPVFHNLQLTSTYEYFELRFDKRIRLFGSVLFTVGTILWLPIVIYVPALAFNQVTGINIHIVTPIVCIVCIFYTCVGGLKAVVWTDVIQSFVMVGSIILIMIKGTIDVGGLKEVLRRNAESGRLETPEFSWDPTVRISTLAIFVGGFLHWLQSSSVNQVMVQRFLSLPTLKAARKSLVIFTIGIIFILGCCMYNGLLIYATYHKCDPVSTKLAKAHDQLMPLLVMDILGIFPGIPGVFVAGVFSAALSSLSTGLNSLAAVVLEDFCKPYLTRPLSERQTSILMRSVVVIFGTLCVGLVFVVENLGMVLQLSASLGAVSNGPLLGIFLLGMCIPWINTLSALTGSIVSFSIMCWICFKSQYDMYTGELKFPQKPITTEGCTYSFANQNLFSVINTTLNYDIQAKSLHHISFLWHTGLGAILTVAVAIIASFAFGRQDSSDVDPSLLTPLIRKFIKPRKYLSVQPDIKERESIIRAYDVKDINESTVREP